MVSGRFLGLDYLPLVRGIELDGQHVQGIPGGDANSSKQAEQGNHSWFAVAKRKEETADARYHAWARCG